MKKKKRIEKLMVLQNLLPVVQHTGDDILMKKILTKISKIVNKL